MNLEELQKERLESFREHFINNIYGVLKNGKIEHPEYLPLTLKNIESFLSESIRLAYEAGAIANEESHLIGKISRKKGFQAGLERAKELIPGRWSYDDDPRYNAAIDETVHAIDAEITKNNER